MRPLARSYVERWTKREFWLYRSIMRGNERELGLQARLAQTLRNTTVKVLLAKMHDTDKEFFNDLLGAKLKYITTRPYRNEPTSKPKLYSMRSMAGERSVGDP